MSPNMKRTAVEVALFLASQWVLDSVMPDRKDEKVKEKQLEALKRLGHHQLDLDEYEKRVANEVIHPDDIQVTFQDIGGLDAIVSNLRESVIYPLLYPNLFTSSSSLLGAPKGVLLFGPPGPLAKESGATFINIAASVLTNKWYGESNKLVSGLFSLARKAQPSIIFIDEIDSFLRERTKGDHEVTGMMKAEFMTCVPYLSQFWSSVQRTGPNDIDAAILRRMPKRFAIELPNYEQRLKILNLMLKDTKMEPGFSMEVLARTERLAMVPVRECMRSAANNQELLAKGQLEGFDLRPLRLEDFFALDETSPLPPVDHEAHLSLD
ncbi:ATPase [Ephemerocybe angulata]|uniref:ATPase n=1 Tax=Ephemerocybe angulata TaxID=980116 RepID=A0A8H6HZ10_9AGAR|nr:ATPase [Tulosesus angulatus]